MPHRPSASLRLRLTALYLLLVIAATTALGVLVYAWSSNDLLSERRVRLLTEGRIAADTISPLISRDVMAAARTLEALGRRFNERLLFIDTTGVVRADSLQFSSSTGSLVGQAILIDDVKSALAGSERASVFRLADGSYVLYATAPIVRGGEVAGVVLVSGDLAALVSTLQRLARRLTLAGVGIALLFLAATWFVASRLTRPLVTLTAAARELGSGDLGVRVAVNSRDEVGTLAETFNTMAEKLQEHDEAQRRFLSDASHELRSPVSSSLLLTEALETEALSQQSSHLLDRLKEQLGRMSRLVNQLLELARLEEWQARHTDRGSQPERREAVVEHANLQHIVDRIFRRLRPLAEAKGIELRMDLAGQPLVNGTEETLERILQNLVENAVKYTEEGTVTVGASLGEPNDQEVVVWVSDTGIGIPDEALPHIFDRFYRADTSRARGDDTGGFGLGLSIVRRRVEALGGRIRVQSHLGQGSRFTLHLPSAQGHSGNVQRSQEGRGEFDTLS